MSLGLAISVGGALFASATPSWAGNEAHVRTPVLWPADCARIVDRSVDPVLQLDYAIPVEDTVLSPDELPDSRTHQFVALCAERPLTELLPSWITRDDLDRSVDQGLIDPSAAGSAAILDESPSWSGCFARITADDDRRPITFEQAALGVAWDTTGLAVGVWSVAGYTFEPPFNLWRDRPGFVKVVDDRGDPDQDLPAIALLGDEAVVEPGATVQIDACVDALEPATVELEWAEFAPQLIWHPLAGLEVDADGPLGLAFELPSEAAERELLIRARLIDGLGRERLAYLPARISVLACPDGGCVEPSESSEPSPAASCRVSERSDGWVDLAWVLFGALFGASLGSRRRP